MSWLRNLFKPSTVTTPSPQCAQETRFTADSHVALNKADTQTQDMLEWFRRDIEKSSQRHMEILAQLANTQMLEIMRAQRQQAVCVVAARLAQAHVQQAPQWPLSMEDIERLAAQAVLTQDNIVQDQALAPQEALREASAQVRAGAQSQRLGAVFGEQPAAMTPERL